MKSIGIAEDGREIFELWTWDDMFNLQKVKALKNISGVNIFWVPSLCFTGSLDYVLFETKEEAYIVAQQNILNLEKNLLLKKKNLEASNNQ